MNPDERIFGSGEPPAEESWDEDVMKAIAAHLVRQMEKTLGQPLELVDDDSVYFDDAFSAQFRTGGESASARTLRFRGIIGGQTVDGILPVRAWVSFYLQNTRLHLEVPGEDLSMEYVETEQGGIWQAEGWEYGEPGENDAFKWFDDE